MNDIGKRIRLIRTRRGMSQTDLARAIGVSHPIISWIENGKSEPTADRLARIKAALGWTDADDHALSLLLNESEPCPCCTPKE